MHDDSQLLDGADILATVRLDCASPDDESGPLSRQASLMSMVGNAQRPCAELFTYD